MRHTAVKRAGCKTLFTDEPSGAIAKRPALLQCLKKLERGDTLPLFSESLTGWAVACANRGVNSDCLPGAIDTTTPTGRAMWR